MAKAWETTVLIVEDEESFVEALTVGLKREGFRVHVAVDGAEALERAQSYRPEVVILDIGLPGMDGYEVARKMREMVPSARLVALTGWAAEDNAHRVREAGFDHYMLKPVQLAELQRLLASPRR